jgi:transposase-like protein
MPPDVTEELLAERGIIVDHITVYRCCAARRLVVSTA